MAKYALEKSPGHLLRRAQQYADDLYKKEVGSGGLTARQFTVLFAISEKEGLSQTDLVRRTGIDRSTLADMISRLTSKGYVARQRTKDDARANSVKLTASGKKILSTHEPKVMKAETAALSLLPKAQQAGFMKALTAYAEALDKMEAEAMAPKRRAAKKTTKKKAPAKRKAAGRKTAAKKTTRKTAAKKAPAKKTARKAGRKKAAKK